VVVVFPAALRSIESVNARKASLASTWDSRSATALPLSKWFAANPRRRARQDRCGEAAYLTGYIDARLAQQHQRAKTAAPLDL